MVLQTARDVDIMMLYISCYEVKIQQLCSSTIYKQNVLILSRLTDSVQCRRGYYF